MAWGELDLGGISSELVGSGRRYRRAGCGRVRRLRCSPRRNEIRHNNPQRTSAGSTTLIETDFVKTDDKTLLCRVRALFQA